MLRFDNPDSKNMLKKMSLDQTVIFVESLKKCFITHQRKSGVVGSLSSLLKRKKIPVFAVNGISFQIQRGEFVGLLGPNGAGKTTTLKILSGLLYPSSGIVQVIGYKPFLKKPNFLRKISLVSGAQHRLGWDLTPQDTFELNKVIYHISQKYFDSILKELGEILQATHLFERPVRKLSLGERMKCELVACLLHSPQVIFLDEPTVGLDVSSQQAIRSFLKEYHKKTGTTIILTSHNMLDVEALVNRLIIIGQGCIRYNGSLAHFQETRIEYKVLDLTFLSPHNPESLKKYGIPESLTPNRIRLEVLANTVPKTVEEILRDYKLQDISILSPSLESLMAKEFTHKKSIYQ